MKNKRFYKLLPLLLVFVLLIQTGQVYAADAPKIKIKESTSKSASTVASYTGMKKVNGVWYYYVNGSIATTYTGLVKYNSKWVYVNKGKLDATYTGLVKYNSKWVYVKNGALDATYTGLVKYNSKWVYVCKGKLDATYTGMVKYKNTWVYVKKGKLETSYTGLAKNAYGWWHMNKGKLDLTYTGMSKNENGWHYVEKGKFTKSFTGMVKYNGTWLYVRNGKWDTTYTGLAKNAYGWWHMSNGVLDLTYTGMSYNENGWHYVENGKYTKDFTGFMEHEGKLIYVRCGKIDTEYSGTIKEGDITYTIEEGVVVNQSKDISVTGVSLNKSSLDLNVNKTAQLVATVKPSDASNKLVTWSSSNASVATVDANGLVTAVGNGIAIITVKTADGSKKATCKVNVTTPISWIDINITELSLNVGDKEQLVATVEPSTASDKSVKWSSSDTTVVTVDANGLVTAVGNGTAIISVKTIDSGIIAKCTVKVTTSVENVTLSMTDMLLNVGGMPQQLVVDVMPNTSSNNSVIWNSSNEKVAIVDEDGVVTPLANGTAVITVTALDGNKTASCKVTVVTPVEGVSLNIQEINLFKGETVQLEATITPCTASNKQIKWFPYESSVAIVDENGLVTAVGDGTATIQVMTVDGTFLASCVVRVRTKVTEINILGDDEIALDIREVENRYYDCEATVSPSDATNKIVYWSSSDESVALAGASMITAIGPGVATITATDADGNCTDSITVYVYDSKPGNLFDSDWNRICSASEPNRVLEVMDGNVYNGAKIQLTTSANSVSQMWRFRDLSNSYSDILILPKCNSEYMLDASEGSGYYEQLEEGDSINIWSDEEGIAVGRWAILKMWDGSYVFRVLDTDLVMGVVANEEGEELVLKKFDPFDINQRWVLENVEMDGDTSEGDTVGGDSSNSGVISDSTMSNVASRVGKQTDYTYADSTIMCSVYCMSYVRGYLYNDYTAPTQYWSANGAVWSSGGGTWRTGNVLSIAKQYIDSGKPVIVHVNWGGYTHYVVAYRYTGSGTNLSDFTVLDPWNGEIKNLSAFSLYGDNQIITFE